MYTTHTDTCADHIYSTQSLIIDPQLLVQVTFLTQMIYACNSNAGKVNCPLLCSLLHVGCSIIIALN